VFSRAVSSHTLQATRDDIVRKTTLILQGDAMLRETLSAALSPLEDELQVVAVGDLEQARRLLETRRVDLAVVDLAAPFLDGFILATSLLRSQPAVPVLALTRDGAPQLSPELDERHLRTLRKPVDPLRLREEVLSLAARSPRGRLTGVSAAGVLQLLNMESRSGVLVVDTPTGRCRLTVEDGQLLDAEGLDARGEEAVFRIAGALAQAESELVLEDLVGPVERTIHRSLDCVLLEAARRCDERLLAARRQPGGATASG
jgi:DNA-binding response OmpR family regulator